MFKNLIIDFFDVKVFKAKKNKSFIISILLFFQKTVYNGSRFWLRFIF